MSAGMAHPYTCRKAIIVPLYVVYFRANRYGSGASPANLFLFFPTFSERLPGVVGSGGETQVVAVREAGPPSSSSARTNSYNEAVRRAVPAVVNIYTAKELRGGRHPFLMTRCSGSSSEKASMNRSVLRALVRELSSARRATF